MSWNAKIPTHLSEWNADPCQIPFNYSLSTLCHFAYQIGDEMFLAKMVTREARKQSFGSRNGCGRIFGRITQQVVTIQIGPISNEKHNEPNILKVRKVELIRLPVPISPIANVDIDASSDNINNDWDDRDNEYLKNQRWIISDKMYKNGYNLFLQSVALAKRGDWNVFKNKIMQNEEKK